MTFPVSHKTVFVLDHGPNFSGPGHENMELFNFSKDGKHSTGMPFPVLSKSLWTCSVEAAVEYCRIVWDIFPVEKLIRFVISDSSSITLNTWSHNEQNLNHLMAALAQIGGPQNVAAKDYNIFHGLNAAIQALCECSEIQHKKRTSLTEDAGKVANRGRIICFTNVKSDLEVKSLLEWFEGALKQHNKLALSSDSLMTIQYCELMLMHIFPIHEESSISLQPKKMVSSTLSTEVHSVNCSHPLAAKLGILVQQHYNLASTTVTGIPMKEEQISGTSANYDVELLHPVAVHEEIFKTGVNTEGIRSATVKDGQCYETVTLKWCTPRSSTVELQHCTSAFRITPVDVNSRPSSCLTNFLLKGRTVMLEMPRKSSSKILSHMLTSHGGEIFIHTLGIGRSILEDPPSISEGCGGRVTDYRINDFGEFMKQNKLVPCEASTEKHELPIEKAKKKLLRLTQYWPLVLGHTAIFNMRDQMASLLDLITKETLDASEVTECKEIIYSLVGIVNKGTSLPVPTAGSKGKGPKREEQYRIMWNELEAFVRCHCTTAEHRSVLEYLCECRTPNPDGERAVSIESVKLQLGALRSSRSIKRLDKLKKDSNDDSKKGSRSKSADSGNSLKETAKKMKIDREAFKKPRTQSLLSLWTAKITSEHEKHRVEFAGRLAGDGPAKLYSHMDCHEHGSG